MDARKYAETSRKVIILVCSCVPWGLGRLTFDGALLVTRFCAQNGTLTLARFEAKRFTAHPQVVHLNRAPPL